MKKNILNNYSAPTFAIYEVAVDKGYGTSITLPGFGSESDELEPYM